MNIAIVGSRSLNDYEFLEKKLKNLIPKNGDTIILSGGARGADTLAAEYARRHNLKFKEYKAEWDRFGKAAGYIRTLRMLQDVDYVIAFYDGKSRGTSFTIKNAYRLGKKVKVILFSPHKLNKERNENNRDK